MIIMCGRSRSCFYKHVGGTMIGAKWDISAGRKTADFCCKTLSIKNFTFLPLLRAKCIQN